MQITNIFTHQTHDLMHETFFQIKLIAYLRISKIMIWTAGTGTLIEVIGESRIRNFNEKIKSQLNPRKLFRLPTIFRLRRIRSGIERENKNLIPKTIRVGTGRYHAEFHRGEDYSYEIEEDRPNPDYSALKNELIVRRNSCLDRRLNKLPSYSKILFIPSAIISLISFPHIWSTWKGLFLFADMTQSFWLFATLMSISWCIALDVAVFYVSLYAIETIFTVTIWTFFAVMYAAVTPVCRYVSMTRFKSITLGMLFLILTIGCAIDFILS